MGNFAKPVDDFDLINRVNGRRKTAVHTEDLVVDDHAQGQEIKHVGEVVPDISTPIFPCALRIKSVGLSNAARLMVATDEMNTMRVS